MASAELWGIILALQASDGVHLGVDNLGVVRHVGRMLDDKLPSSPFELLPDVHRTLRIQGLGSVPRSRVTRMRLWFVLVLFVV